MTCVFMPNTFIHILSTLILLLLIYLFDKELAKDRKQFMQVGGLILLTNLIDLDHLFSTPIYDPTRCSINNHFFHNWFMMPVYVLGMLWQTYRYVFLAILMHLFLDWIWCVY